MKTQAQANPALAAPAPVARRKPSGGFKHGLQPSDSEEAWNPTHPVMKAIWPVVGSWPFTCLWVSTVFLTICYVGGDFRKRSFDNTWNPAYNPERLFKQEKVKAKAAQVNPVQATVAQNNRP